MTQHSTLLLGTGALLMFCALATPSLAQGTAAEERYIVARDLAVANFSSEKVPDVKALTRAEPDEKRARTDLDRQMRAILGAVKVAGYGAGTFNLDTLFAGEMGFGHLDGLRFEADERRSAIIVTTRWLMSQWVRGEKDAAWKRLDEAFRDQNFYTRAIDTDAAVAKFAELPLGEGSSEKPAFAMLAGRTQDQMPAAPNEVFVAAVKGDRAFIAFAPLKQRITAPACLAAHRAAEKRLIKAASTPEAQEKNDAEFLKCFAERAPKHAQFAEAVKQAKALYDKMPAK